MPARVVAIVVFGVAAAALAAPPEPPKSPGIESEGYVWNERKGELAAALRARGDPERGKVAYEYCRGCHRADGSGRPDGSYPQLAGQHATVLIKQMADIRAGRRDNPRMYPFATEHVLSTREIADVAAYLSRLEIPSTNGKGPGADLATGERLYARDCAGCHGKSGEGSARQFYPMVAGQHYLYLLRQGREIRDGQRRNANPKMAKVVKPYSDAELQAVSDYMSRLVHARGAPSGSKGRKSWAAAPSYRREAARRGSTRSKERCA